MNLPAKIIDYISITQPAIEKAAEDKKVFLTKLSSKLATMVRNCNITKAEADKIYKEASLNPATVLHYMDITHIPSMGGTLVEKRSNSKDPLGDWVRRS